MVRPTGSGGRGRNDDGRETNRGTGRGRGGSGEPTEQSTPQTEHSQPSTPEGSGNKRADEEYVSPKDHRKQRKQRVEFEEPDSGSDSQQSAERRRKRREERNALARTRDEANFPARQLRLVSGIAERLMKIEYKDPANFMINYGHRNWPLPIQFHDDYISELMNKIWPRYLDWRNDILHAQRCRTVVMEFQGTGLPQTIHADVKHETEDPRPAGMNNPAYKCPCWTNSLGYEWFNHSDASLVISIGPDWGLNNQHILVHLLTRLLIAMTMLYVKDSSAFIENNPTFRPTRQIRKRNWWPSECYALLKKVISTRGIVAIGGTFEDLRAEDKVLVSRLTGIPVVEITAKMRTMKQTSKPETQAPPEPIDDVVNSVRPHSLRRFVFTPPEMYFWEKYLLGEKIMNPLFTRTMIPDEQYYEFFNITSKNPKDTLLQAKLKTFINHFISNSARQRGTRGPKLQAEAVAAYNKIAEAQGAAPYDPEFGYKNNAEWCKIAADTTIQISYRRKLPVHTGELPPTDYEARDAADMSDKLEDLVRLNLAFQKSLAQQQQQHTTATVPPPTARSTGNDWEAEQLLLEEALRQSAALHAAQHGRQADAAFRIRSVETIERERQEKLQAEMQERGKEKAPDSSNSDSSASSTHLKGDRGGPSKRRKQGETEQEERSRRSPPSPPNTDLGQAPPPNPPNTNQDQAPPNHETHEEHYWQIIFPEVDPNIDRLDTIEWKTTRRRLFVGADSVAAQYESKFDDLILDEDLANSDVVQQFLELAHLNHFTSSKKRASHPPSAPKTLPDSVEDAETRAFLESILKEIEVEQQQWKTPQKGNGDKGKPSPGGGGGDGGGGGGQQGQEDRERQHGESSQGGGGPPDDDGGNNDDPLREMNALEFLMIYDNMAINHPDVLQYMEWPSKLVEFHQWVVERWPSMYYNVQWPRPVPLQPAVMVFGWDDVNLDE